MCTQNIPQLICVLEITGRTICVREIYHKQYVCSRNIPQVVSVREITASTIYVFVKYTTNVTCVSEIYLK
jgi:hypothetical protein